MVDTSRRLTTNLISAHSVSTDAH